MGTFSLVSVPRRLKTFQGQNSLPNEKCFLRHKTMDAVPGERIVKHAAVVRKSDGGSL